MFIRNIPNVPVNTRGVFCCDVKLAVKQEQSFLKVGDVVKHIRKKPYPTMRIIEIVPPGYCLCEWYSKHWKKWERTLFKPVELVKK
ncbi:unnamed protein product [Commensalibacter communis]|uniref:Uncharacterized protein n=1 Tax=Commensalibacter communis TaxID=2972786 RepID=A0A9W4TQZ7_9PROT|nr:unnamed protein product [Commensalibacter communis]CAI3958867.1 unnamed protein product [Commensalibacter communis]CAI3960293.1 unnamed protein product [Commensalibacter communis]